MQTLAPNKVNGIHHTLRPKKEHIRHDEEIYSVKRSWNYNQFKKLDDNRNVDDVHIKRLAESFKTRHLVSVGIVNELYEVIDGQNRLEACKLTGCPFYYIVVEGYTLDDVIVLNSNQKNWNQTDRLDSFCAQGLKPYLQFRQFMVDFPDFGFQATERILTLRTWGKRIGKIADRKVQMKDFENGKLVIPDLDQSYTIAKKLMDFKPYYSGFSRGKFVSAMLSLFKSNAYNHKEMIIKLKSGKIKLQHCQNVEAYKLLLEDIYNWKRLKENKVSFRYE